MADIFLSYTEKDREAVHRLAETLQSVGWSVWWDRRIPAGLTWRIVLERELQSMRCMVVLWSSNSVQSDWVCEEAAEGRQLGRIERVRPPAGFREIQAADLVDWDGSRDYLGLQQLLDDIGRLIGKPDLVPRQTPGPDALSTEPVSMLPVARHERVVSVIAAAAGLVFVLVLVYMSLSQPKPADALNKVEPPPMTAAAAPASATPSVVVAANPTVAVAAAASSRPAAAVHAQVPSISQRCIALQERLALGETLSSQSQLFYRQECRK